MSTARKRVITFLTFLYWQVVLSIAIWENVDITKFYQENDKIWTVNTTVQTKMFCKIDFVNKTTEKYTEFERVYFWNDKMTQEYLHGQFIKSNILTERITTYDGMMIRSQNGSIYTSTEILLKVYGNYTCGIFEVRLGPSQQSAHYDIRVKDSTIYHPDAGCVEYFLTFTRNMSTTTIYNNSCQETR
uniref:Putative group i salivary lipocalin n=1 Tax=Rhipicephalus pulchellus TaxID=72859 RepID=L7LQC3_RHIPC